MEYSFRCLLVGIAIVGTGGDQVAAEVSKTPFLHSQEVRRVYDALGGRSNRRDAMKRAVSNGRVDWSQVDRPDTSLGIHDVRRSWVEGFMLFADVGAKPRLLPLQAVASPIPFIGIHQHAGLAASIPIPHRAVRFRVHPDKALEDIVGQAYQRVGLRRDVSVSDDGTHATIRIYFKSPGKPLDDVKVLSPEPSLPQPLPGKRTATVYVRKVGDVVFHARFPLAELNLQKCAADVRDVAIAKVDRCLQIWPERLPRELTEAFGLAVRRAASPGLQPRDGESETDFRARTVGARWMLDAVDLMLTRVGCISCRLQNAQRAIAPTLEWNFRIEAPPDVLKRLVGPQADTRTMRFAELATLQPDQFLHVRSQLPDSLRRSISEWATTLPNEALTRAINDWANTETHEIFVCADTKSGCNVFGAIELANAEVIVQEAGRATGHSGSTLTLRPEVGLLPKEITIGAKDAALYFSLGDEGAASTLERLLEVDLKPTRGPVRIDLNLDVWALRQLQADGGRSPFARLPATALLGLERFWYDVCLPTKKRDLDFDDASTEWRMATLEKQMAEFNSFPDSAVREHERWFNRQQYARKLRFDAKTESMAHWLQPGKASVRVRVDYDENAFQVRLTVDWDLFKIAELRPYALHLQLASKKDEKLFRMTDEQLSAKLAALKKKLAELNRSLPDSIRRKLPAQKPD